MIIKLKNSTTEAEKQHLIEWAEKQGVSVCTVTGTMDTLLSFIGDTCLAHMRPAPTSLIKNLMIAVSASVI